jgi:nitrogenase molybdenum-cofactor synthesis protein NifE
LRIAYAIGDRQCVEKAKEFTSEHSQRLQGFLDKYKPNFKGKKAAIYVGGGFKAISLIRQFNEMGIETVVVGTQTGKQEDYEIIENLCKKDALF